MSHLGESPGILVQIASREKLDNNLLLVSTSSHADKLFYVAENPRTNEMKTKDFNDWLVSISVVDEFYDSIKAQRHN